MRENDAHVLSSKYEDSTVDATTKTSQPGGPRMHFPNALALSGNPRGPAPRLRMVAR